MNYRYYCILLVLLLILIGCNKRNDEVSDSNYINIIEYDETNIEEIDDEELVSSESVENSSNEDLLDEELIVEYENRELQMGRYEKASPEDSMAEQMSLIVDSDKMKLYLCGREEYEVVLERKDYKTFSGVIKGSVFYNNATASWEENNHNGTIEFQLLEFSDDIIVTYSLDGPYLYGPFLLRYMEKSSNHHSSTDYIIDSETIKKMEKCLYCLEHIGDNYDSKNTDFYNLIRALFVYTYDKDFEMINFTEIEDRYLVGISYDYLSDLANEYLYNITLPRESAGGFLFKNDCIYIDAFDYSLMGCIIYKINRVVRTKEGFSVELYEYFVSECEYEYVNGITNEYENPVSDYDDYLDYSISEMQEDSFVELCSVKEAKLVLDEGKYKIKALYYLPLYD